MGGCHNTFDLVFKNYLGGNVQEFAGRSSVCDTDTTDQIAFRARPIVVRRLLYADLTA